MIMKKLILAIIVSAAAFSASAQEFTSTPEFYTGSPYLSVGMVDYIGFGFTAPHEYYVNYSSSFEAHTSMLRNTEFFFNLVYMKFHPYPSGSLGMGMDLRWNGYRLKSPYYWRADGNGAAIVTDGSATYSKISRSVLRIMSMDIPLDYSQQIGPVGITLGVSCELNLPAHTHFKGIDGSSGTKVKEKYGNLDTELITPGFHLYATYLGMGLYLKYRPIPQLDSPDSPAFTTWTAGIILN